MPVVIEQKLPGEVNTVESKGNLEELPEGTRRFDNILSVAGGVPYNTILLLQTDDGRLRLCQMREAALETSQLRSRKSYREAAFVVQFADGQTLRLGLQFKYLRQDKEVVGIEPLGHFDDGASFQGARTATTREAKLFKMKKEEHGQSTFGLEWLDRIQFTGEAKIDRSK